MDEGIEMLPIEERNEESSSEPQLPWWVCQVSTDDDKIVAFKSCACRQHFARFGERGGRTLQQAKFDLIRQVTHDLLLFYFD